MPEGKTKKSGGSEKHQAVATCSLAEILARVKPAPMPEALRPRATIPVVGGRRVRRQVSGYVTAQSARAERRGIRESVVERLLRVRASVAAGSTLLEAVADGTVEGWRAREALADAIGTLRVPQWDAERLRSKADRLAAVAKALEIYGYVERQHLGGWRVS